MATATSLRRSAPCSALLLLLLLLLLLQARLGDRRGTREVDAGGKFKTLKIKILKKNTNPLNIPMELARPPPDRRRLSLGCGGGGIFRWPRARANRKNPHTK